MLIVIVMKTLSVLILSSTLRIGSGGRALALRLLESLVLAVRAVTVLDNQRSIRHLPIVSVLFVSTVVVLDDDGRLPLLVLLLELLAPLVRAVSLLDALGGLVQLALLPVGQRQVGEVGLEGLENAARRVQELREVFGGGRRRRRLDRAARGRRSLRGQRVAGRTLQRPRARRAQAGARRADVVVAVRVVAELEVELLLEAARVEQRLHERVAQAAQPRRVRVERVRDRAPQRHYVVRLVLDALRHGGDYLLGERENLRVGVPCVNETSSVTLHGQIGAYIDRQDNE